MFPLLPSVTSRAISFLLPKIPLLGSLDISLYYLLLLLVKVIHWTAGTSPHSVKILALAYCRSVQIHFCHNFNIYLEKFSNILVTQLIDSSPSKILLSTLSLHFSSTVKDLIISNTLQTTKLLYPRFLMFHLWTLPLIFPAYPVFYFSSNNYSVPLRTTTHWSYHLCTVSHPLHVLIFFSPSINLGSIIIVTTMATPSIHCPSFASLLSFANLYIG